MPFVYGLIHFKELDKPLKVLFYFVCYGTFTEVLIRLLIIFANIKNTMPFVHLYGLITYPLLFIFYSYILKNIKRRYFLVLGVLFVVYWGVNSLFIQSIYEFPTLPNSLGDMLIILFAIVYFYNVMLEANIMKLADEPLVWINTAILIYFTGNLFYYILFNVILEASREFSKITVAFSCALMALLYSLMTVGFFKARKRKHAGQP